MIPFERNPGDPSDPQRGSRERLNGGRVARGGPDEALLRELRGRQLLGAPHAALGEVVAGWLVAPLLLTATVAGMLLVVRGPDQLFGWVFGGVLALGLGWILVSSLSPAAVDRTCPKCGADALVRLDARTTLGTRCRSCAWRDASASSFLLAEDDGAPLEDIALRERRRSRRF